MACLSLAAKMEECKVPLLTEFPVEDYNFEGKVIQRMELLVLNTLEWKMSSITPLDYLSYFISKFCKQRSRNVVPRIIELIYATVQGKILLCFQVFVEVQFYVLMFDFMRRYKFYELSTVYYNSSSHIVGCGSKTN